MRFEYAHWAPPRFSVFLCLFSIFISINLMAETQQDSPDSQVKTDEVTSEVDLADMVISSGRIFVPSDQVTGTTTIVDADTIAVQQKQLVLDVIQDTAGIYIRRAGFPGAQASIFTRGTDPDHTLVRVDGIRLIDPSSTNATSYLDHFSVNNLQSIVIHRGPQSALWGSDAIGGTIDLTTAFTDEPFEAVIDVYGGSFSTVQNAFTIRGSQEHLRYSVGGGFTTHNGQSVIELDTENDGYISGNLSSRFDIMFDENSGVELAFRYIQAESNFDVVDFSLITFMNELNSSGMLESWQWLGKIEPYFMLMEDVLETRLRISTHVVERNFKGNASFYPSHYEGFLLETDWQNTLTVSEDLTFVGGVQYMTETATFKTPSGTARPEQDQYGFYIQGYWQPLSLLTVEAGGRFDRHDEQDNSLTGKFGARIDATQFLAIRGSVGTGFNAPTLFERFDNSFGSANPDLEAEESLGFDFGTELHDEHGYLKITFFNNDIDNLITFDPVTFVNVNLNETRTQGVELEASYAISQLFIDEADLGYTDRLLLNYTYTDTENKDTGARLAQRPLHQFSLTYLIHPHLEVFGQSFQDEMLTFGVGYRFVSSRDDFVAFEPSFSGLQENDSYNLLELTMAIQINESTQFRMKLSNLTNSQYQEALGFSSPGRAVFAGLNVTLR